MTDDELRDDLGASIRAALDARAEDGALGETPSPFSVRSHIGTRRRLVGAMAAVAIVAAAVALFATTRPESHGLEVVGSSTSTSAPGLGCPVNGVGPHGETHGTMPGSGSRAPKPDYVAVMGRDGNIVGFMQRNAAGPVVDCDLRTVVGRLYPNRGFVAKGVDPKTVPTLLSPAKMRQAKQSLLARISVTPATGLTDGQVVSVHLSYFAAGVKVWLSECATSRVSAAGCGLQVAAQPFVVTDGDGNGVTTLVVTDRAPVRGYDSADVRVCATTCLVVATRGVGEAYTSAPITFGAATPPR